MILTRTTLISAVLLAAASASADEALEEVVVTADFRDSRLLSSIGSITVLGAQVLEERAAQHLEEVLSAAPNVSWSTGASRSRFIQVRGVGDLEQYAEPKYYPSVGLVIDELELGSAASSAMTFDIAQVEVLRGPQGTRFGASAHAGMVKLSSNAPGEEVEVMLSGGVGNYGSVNLGAVVSGALTESVKARVVAQRHESDSYIDNQFLDRNDLNGFEETTGRVLLQWDASQTSRYDIGVYAFASQNGYDTYSLDNTRDTWSDQPGVDQQDSVAITGKGSWSLGEQTTLQAIATYTVGDLLYSYDVDWVSAEFCQRYTCSSGHDTAMEIFDRERDRATFELRLLGGNEIAGAGDIRYVAGLYGNRSAEDLGYAYPSFWYGLYENASSYNTDRYAAYGETEYGVNDVLTVSAGMRVERFGDDYTDSHGVAHDNDDNLWNWEISAEYQFSANSYGYATVSVANKPGGVNVSASSQFDFMSPEFQGFMLEKLGFAKETLLNRELGLKTTQMDGRLVLRSALFYATRENAQLENWMWDNGAGLWVGYLDSTGDVDSYGLELESSFAVSDSVQLFASIGLLETEVNAISTFDLDVFDFVTKTDREQTKSPQYQFNAGIRAALSEQLAATLEVEGRAESFYGYYHDGKLDSYELVNGNFTWVGEALTINVWGRNLADEDYATHGLYFGADPRDDFGAWSNQSYYQFAAPRTYGVNISWGL